jgi:hypothetical protein
LIQQPVVTPQGKYYDPYLTWGKVTLIKQNELPWSQVFKMDQVGDPGFPLPVTPPNVIIKSFFSFILEIPAQVVLRSRTAMMFYIERVRDRESDILPAFFVHLNKT